MPEHDVCVFWQEYKEASWFELTGRFLITEFRASGALGVLWHEEWHKVKKFDTSRAAQMRSRERVSAISSLLAEGWLRLGGIDWPDTPGQLFCRPTIVPPSEVLSLPERPKNGERTHPVRI